MELFNRSSLSTAELAEIKRLHFFTRRLVNAGIAGEYRSAFRGHGIEFEEVREYTPGDDVRSIDWKVTARMNAPFVKSYREERELTVVIAVDVSASTHSGTCRQLRERLIAQVGAVLTLIALNNNDKVGLVTFSDRLETYHPPRKGRGAVWRILKEVLNPAVYSRGTDLSALFVFLNSVLKRRSIIFILSDFFASGYDTALATLAKRHDCVAVRVKDPVDTTLPPIGLISLCDPETGTTTLLDLGSTASRTAYEELSANAQKQFGDTLQRYRIDCIELQTNKSFVHELKRYFERRRKRF